MEHSLCVWSNAAKIEVHFKLVGLNYKKKFLPVWKEGVSIGEVHVENTRRVVHRGAGSDDILVCKSF